MTLNVVHLKKILINPYAYTALIYGSDGSVVYLSSNARDRDVGAVLMWAVVSRWLCSQRGHAALDVFFF